MNTSNPETNGKTELERDLSEIALILEIPLRIKNYDHGIFALKSFIIGTAHILKKENSHLKKEVARLKEENDRLRQQPLF